MAIYYVNAGWVDPEYFEDYLWSEGYWNAEYIEAETRGQARAKFIAVVNERGDDVQWTDKISIRKVDAIPEPERKPERLPRIDQPISTETITVVIKQQGDGEMLPIREQDVLEEVDSE